MLNRRDFLSRAAAATTGAFLLPNVLEAHAANFGTIGSIGFQSWTIREQLASDPRGTLKMMAGYGYQSIEMCSPPSYKDAGFGTFLSYSARELKKLFDDSGITCTSCHYGFDELKQNGQERMDFARELGIRQMVVSSFGLGDDAKLSDWHRAADAMNRIGEQGKKNGIQMGFHNHNQEFEKKEGKLIYDELLDRLEPALVKMQFQVWVVSIGYKAADYFKKHPGRFISAHLSDWSGAGEEQVPLGKGKVDWKDFFDAAKVGGLQNFYVEMEPETFKESAAFLKKMN